MRVVNGRDALIGTIKELPNLLNELTADSARMKSIGKNAKLYVLKYHNIDEIKVRILSLVKTILYDYFFPTIIIFLIGHKRL